MKGSGTTNGKRKSKRRRSSKRHKKPPAPATENNSEASKEMEEQQQDEDDVEQAPPTKRRRNLEPSGSISKKKSSFLDRVELKHLGRVEATLFIKMRLRLSGGHFRMINEQLYTCSGDAAFMLFKNEPELFNAYHAGYQEQMSHWPEQPVNAIIKWLKNQSPSLTVADFGCGNAILARNVKNKVFSIDLVSNDPSVISCDMSNTPLGSSSVDVAVFCLSLMGTNYPSYLKEAKRVLKLCGWLLIAEVRSRFDPHTNGADPEKFSEAVTQLGFSLVSKNFTNKMFVLFFFKKKERPSPAESIRWPELKPCIYKRR